ncbi:MAG: 1,2-diacylglycerol 3-glucosyltransferase [Berkelbacteria bacterium GW2011_GWA1_36_9]|uniref:1,2-diacylglycerol 3-glucosyltransferase n=1 Tax=Berkelbacteria bacterium GW2011_GWA1_36_9 TaxID=1618331 RepID=A0A0G0FUJ5_9BACT|nr:MAG: 1,2-diacylglycerol 3-glucosyltransferase [Berkelbacteria bacterium GW2011_GWA1_36_9]
MRVGIFSECYHPTLNGVVISIDTFKAELEKRGHKIFIFAPGKSNCKDNPFNIFRYPALPWPKDYPLAFPFLAPLQNSQIRDLGLDIVHSQHIFTMGRLGMRVAHQLDIPMMHTYHTLITEYSHYIPLFPKNFTKNIIVNLSRKYCNKCNQVVTPSSQMKKILRSYGIKTPIEVIPTGVYLENFKDPYHKEVLKTKWQIPEDKIILLYVSRIAKEKNLDFLFKAIKLLHQKRQDFHLLMVGGGPELEYYQNLVKKWELSSYVTFTGMQEKEKANRFFGAADIFVFPSITETQGIVITEAMASGIPAVAIDKMGPSDIIKNGVDGFLTPLNIDSFCAKIETLLNNKKLREKFGAQALKDAENFSAKVCADKMEILYERTINNFKNYT